MTCLCCDLKLLLPFVLRVVLLDSLEVAAVDEARRLYRVLVGGAVGTAAAFPPAFAAHGHQFSSVVAVPSPRLSTALANTHNPTTFPRQYTDR